MGWEVMLQMVLSASDLGIAHRGAAREGDGTLGPRRGSATSLTRYTAPFNGSICDVAVTEAYSDRDLKCELVCPERTLTRTAAAPLHTGLLC